MRHYPGIDLLQLFRFLFLAYLRLYGALKIHTSHLYLTKKFLAHILAKHAWLTLSVMEGTGPTLDFANRIRRKKNFLNCKTYKLTSQRKGFKVNGKYSEKQR